MVRQVKKICMFLVAVLILITAICGTVSAATYDVYEGNLSSTQLTYFRDILGNQSIMDNYVVFRDGQYTYKMVVGDIVYNNNMFTSDKECKVYSIDTGSGYNSYYTYNTTTIDSFVLNTNSRIVYSDLAYFPQLESRGDRYEILTTIILCIAGCCYIIRNIFYNRRR